MVPSFPQDVPAANKYCRVWDRLFHPHMKCPAPTNRESSTNTYIPPDGGYDREVIQVVGTLAFIGFFMVLIITLVVKFRKNNGIRHRFRREQRPQSRASKPNFISRLGTRWNGSESTNPTRSSDVEMGRFNLKRNCSRARSFAKLNPGINVPNHTPVEPSPISRTEHLRHERAAPTYAPPAYENTPRGNPIADEFTSDEARGIEPRVGTPPPTYHQRTRDRCWWEDDGTPVLGYESPWPLR